MLKPEAHAQIIYGQLIAGWMAHHLAMPSDDILLNFADEAQRYAKMFAHVAAKAEP